jgi:hypothetical protein
MRVVGVLNVVFLANTLVHAAGSQSRETRFATQDYLANALPGATVPGDPAGERAVAVRSLYSQAFARSGCVKPSVE